MVTSGSDLRDLLRDNHGFSTEPLPGDGVVQVDTAHRLKGLEFDSVVMAVDTETPNEALLYVGVSRAVSELVMVAPGALAARFGAGGT